MIINRYGMSYELTEDEIYKAYKEQEHKYDIQDIEYYLDDFSDDELVDGYGVTRDVIVEHYDEMANEKRRNQDKYDMHWEDARNTAITEVLSRYM